MDSNQMKQVFINIVNNSFQAMPQGGSLTIRASADNRRNAVVEFRDTGVGIAKEDVAKIFAPFFSTKTEGNGTGLGLSISERIVQNHGGRIEVESVPGAGSVFKVIVPLYQETPSAADRGSEKREYV
jgi:signal transduction histidine kinase